MSVVYKRWRIQAGMTLRFQTDARPWLPADATLTGFVPNFSGLPFTAEGPVISNGIVQQKITANADASPGTYVVPVALTNNIGEVDQQDFILEVV